jgi:hypothetical protein
MKHDGLDAMLTEPMTIWGKHAQANQKLKNA